MNIEAAKAFNHKAIEALGIAESIVMRIRELSPHEQLHWGHVGDIQHTINALKEVEDRLYGKNEYAPENVARL